MFDDQILASYIKNFLGYGNSNGEICFVGLEEGIGISENDLKKIPPWLLQRYLHLQF